MFPDSQIAKHFKLGETKAKYTIQYGIYPIFKDLLLDVLKNTAFTFKFDESTTQQVKKQYNRYVQYWSKHHNCIKMVYCGAVMVGHCAAEKLWNIFLNLQKKINVDLKLMLHIGMDGPSLNMKFKDLLRSLPHIKSLGTTILSIGTSSLHIVHNTFRAGVNALNFNIDSFIIDSIFFFKLSAARRADYKQIQEFTDVISHLIQKHSSARWVTLRKISVTVSEQYQNLRE